jgi:aminoglycoside phosphotransferase (APT) family kinase protein
MRMHSGQADITVELVARCVADQLPRWRDLPVRPVPSDGTVNALFRLGDEIVLRFPLLPSRSDELRAGLREEQDHARRIGPQVPLEVPEPLALCEPSDEYPGPWTAYRWIPGEPASRRNVADFEAFARDLAEFVHALHAIDTEGRRWSGSGRGGPLGRHDEGVRQALAESVALVDTERLEPIWRRCLAAPAPASPDVWVHADLMPGNLIVRDGRLVAVIDFETVTAGDPAVDLVTAWNLLPRIAREPYRQALDVDDAEWVRGRGWAFVQAIVALPYYVDTNPGMAAIARHTLDALLEADTS